MEALTEGLRVGNYELLRLIGAGGMGEVYLARDHTLDRNVAIKFVAAQQLDHLRTKRLLHEARAVAALDHPNICTVHNVDIDTAGRLYMVMQYVEGETLAARLAKGSLTPAESLTLVAKIADALRAAHNRGIVHRDLKPQNIILTPAGEPKLLDFGIAKMELASEGSAATTTSLTDQYSVIGTPAYMSPEQVQGKPVDRRGDLFSMGAILFECLTGRRAFGGSQPVEVMAQVLHTQPPRPSGLQPSLDSRFDDLCRRLLAKEPVDRFQSADEVLGALRVLQPAGSLAQVSHERRWLPRWNRRRVWQLAALVAVLAAGTAVAWRFRTSPLPPVPPEAERWYQRGTNALSEGAFQSASAALEKAISLFPEYPLAFARLAEARSELDDERGAERALVRVSNLLPDQSRLPTDERLRLEGIRSLVLRDLDAAIKAYEQLARRNPNDPVAWLDLGRAQEAALKLDNARASYGRAVAADSQYAAAYLHIGIIDAWQGRNADSFLAYSNAEQLYRSAGRTDGEAEALIWRGALLDGVGQFGEARAALERARSIGQSIKSPFHIVRAQMYLSSVTASEGRFADAERLASEAVDTALAAGLETTAADGLIDLAATLQLASKSAESWHQLQRAKDLAEKRDARRTSARASVQMASWKLDQGDAAGAIAMLERPLTFLKERRFTRLEMTALSIAARAYQQLDDIPRAHAMATDGLTLAEATRNDIEIGVALNTIAALSTALGRLPDALALRQRAEDIHRRQNDAASLPYDLANRAELLIRLGRVQAGSDALTEVETGISRKLDGYAGRQQRVFLLRALTALIMGRPEGANRVGESLAHDPNGTDAASVLGPGLRLYAQARLGRNTRLAFPDDAGRTSPVPRALWRERQYWLAAAALYAREAPLALSLASDGLEKSARIGNDELNWRLAAVASIAAARMDKTEEQQRFAGMARAALDRLRREWGTAFGEYESRPDLVELRRIAAL